ncbi:MAG: hypothetical protein ABGW97_03080 [Christiangramia sp.]|uniref:hypothetical protein n=1 Tax=Christiangramia sp. TaxID=1931228 RepID=UPI0032429461
MTTFELITLVLSSSLLSTGLGIWANHSLHSRNYKKEYYKKILDKRITAYEKLREVTKLLSTHCQQGNNVVHAYVSTQNLFNHLCEKVRNTVDDGLWLSVEGKNLISELNIFLINEFSNHINYSQDKDSIDKEFSNRALMNREVLINYNESIIRIISKDIKNLHKVEDFFKKNMHAYVSNYELKAPKYSQFFE